MIQKLPNIHPGTILLEEFMIPYQLTQNRLAKDLGVPPRRINEIIHGKRSVTADTALRLSVYFGTTAQFWLNLQDHFELEEARSKVQLNIKPLLAGGNNASLST